MVKNWTTHYPSEILIDKFGMLAMKTDEEIDSIFDSAESEIKAVLNKYNLEIGMLYDDGVAITLRHTQQHESGDYSIRERESF